LASEYEAILDRPPAQDYLVHTIVRREANGTPLMTAEIVIAGRETRERHALAREYPLHFRKSYFPAALAPDPREELAIHEAASAVLRLPPPIGTEPRVFRACLIPGVPYDRCSPFGVEPEERNLSIAAELALPAAAGLWRFVEGAFAQHLALHEAGIAHGDAELHNLIVSAAPLEAVLIDFGSAGHRGEDDDARWEERRERDLQPLLREAVFLQCALGRQPGALGDAAWNAAARLFRDGDRFRRAIDDQAALPG
jgi:hypothetical protein